MVANRRQIGLFCPNSCLASLMKDQKPLFPESWQYLNHSESGGKAKSLGGKAKSLRVKASLASNRVLPVKPLEVAHWDTTGWSLKDCLSFLMNASMYPLKHVLQGAVVDAQGTHGVRL